MESIIELANHMIEGELLAEEKLDPGLDELRAARALEDGLKYDEPPAWMIPLRHTIGANLVHAGRFAEAEQIYRDDLKRLPENGWSLFGLSQALAAQQKEGTELDAARARFNKVWAKADVKISRSWSPSRSPSANEVGPKPLPKIPVSNPRHGASNKPC
jgi:tetratricopeptide (TPR) repeat protein